MLLRPVRDTADDADAVQAVTAASFGGSRVLAGVGWPPEQVARLRGRARYLARTDPGGCWLAEDPVGGPVGVALSLKREFLWGLSLLAVVPAAQGKGVGAALLARAMGYGRGCLRGLVCGTRHPIAARVYRRAGFTLHPAMCLKGVVDPARLDAPDGAVHEGTPRHRDLMDSVDRRTRGGAHGPDHEELLGGCRLFVADDLAGSGYCYLDGGKVELLAATSRRLATRLLTAALLAVPEGGAARVPHLTADQQWALDVGLAAGLELSNSGYLCLRGMRPPAPYVPSDAFL
ncbi:GNAT family N-acetyltransferase [Streptantibioticus ferralitis]|uniref:GNAT family N-acetyltransferase n=1 Tax=Streptantibioticus ferralitis TaxID=236510 RepID=A0ABT5Z8B5_9ACTN|nr:GNAT family N-acetyltransferase [Streptantibioticus ferralitis]MDF2260044.1 GNAT family N-acetyltransferase [Streptantibioticus ferralitis]